MACHHSTLELLIEYAFDVQRFQVSGGPAWISAVREYWYDIDALPPSGLKSATENPSTSKAPLNHEQREMLQSLLMDRFHLRFHRETREGPVYLLTLGKGALKLKEAKHDSEFEWVGSVAGAAVNGDGLAGKNISMPVMAQRLSWYLRKPVFDQTGLKGFFDFEYKYDSDEAHPDVTSCIITSLQALGLKVKPSQGPVRPSSLMARRSRRRTDLVGQNSDMFERMLRITLRLMAVLFLLQFTLGAQQKTGLNGGGTLVMQDGKTREFTRFFRWIHYTLDLNEIDRSSGYGDLPKKNGSEVRRIDFLTFTQEEEEQIQHSLSVRHEDSGGRDIRKAAMKLADGTTITVFLWNPNADMLMADGRRVQLSDPNLKSIVSKEENEIEASQKD